MTVLPPTCNCDGIKTIDTPCPIHGFDTSVKETEEATPLKPPCSMTVEDLNLDYTNELLQINVGAIRKLVQSDNRES